MIYGSVCSGIEAASVAWEPLGWRPAFFSEIEKFPRAVLGHHWPDVPLHGDFTTINEGDYDPIDVLVGGTPCQSFSVAGKRLGLDDPRGNLTIEYLGLARRLRPRWLVWENVPGILSSGKGRDFGAFLGLLGELGYGWAYRILDAQYFGVPQRRRRVFVVGHSSGDWRRAAAVLFEPESLRRDSPPSRETGEGIAPTISARPTGGGGLGTDFDLDGGLATVSVPAIAGALQERDAKGSDSDTKTGHLIPIAFSSKDYAQDASAVSPPLRAMGSTNGRDNGGGQVAIAIQERAVSENLAAGPQGKGYQEGIAYTLEGRAKVQAVAFKPSHYTRGKDGAPSSVAAPLSADADRGDQDQVVAFAQNTRDEVRVVGGDGQIVGALPAQPGTRQQAYLADRVAVRRLTPIECERLQGFPDNFTQIPWRGKPADQCPDGPRYKALGNSMAVPVMRWIGERIQAMESVS